MFIHPTQGYNILLHLDLSVLPRYLHNVNVDHDLLMKRSKYANKTQQDEAVKILPGFDPAQLFVADLQVSLLVVYDFSLLFILTFLAHICGHFQSVL